MDLGYKEFDPHKQRLEPKSEKELLTDHTAAAHLWFKLAGVQSVGHGWDVYDGSQKIAIN